MRKMRAVTWSGLLLLVFGRERPTDVVVRYNFATGLDSPSPFRQHALQRLVAA